ncbi:alkaline phosphatase [Neolewinella agarilytica]|uniref:Alkaline phosphatase n=1 Tax=Neolewinella agarilytica TaxID=478744 RepID=A0A1H9BNA5_9BACT|nr:alkaline phosphatase [Neolewinella agarilytica]SEP90231.1 alkaline phosphatase [Neolewinella agarilytica]
MNKRVFPLLSVFCLLLTACPPVPQDTLPAAGRTDASTLPAEPDTAPAVAPNTPQVETAAKARRPKNIILMIGDGMGVTQISAGMYSNNNKLNLEQFPVVGLHKSYSGDNLITDSAAGATAFSAGVKTYNGAVGVGMDTMPVVTILELAEAAGLPTGLVATCSIVHATPASFVAHNRQRKNYEEIATDFLKTEVDLLIGGGAKFFDRRKSDDRKLTKELEKRNYVVDNFVEKDAKDLRPDPARNYAYLTADGEPLPVAQGRDYLLPAVKIAPDFLDKRDRNNKGFFLMIEGAQIDWGGHANDSEYIISEMLEFNEAIGEVLKFAKADGETLVIVTADHETGGYAIQNGSSLNNIDGAFTSDYHTADLIPVFAYGPGSEHFSGIFENTAIFDKMKKLFAFD